MWFRPSAVHADDYQRDGVDCGTKEHFDVWRFYCRHCMKTDAAPGEQFLRAPSCAASAKRLFRNMSRQTKRFSDAPRFHVSPSCWRDWRIFHNMNRKMILSDELRSRGGQDVVYWRTFSHIGNMKHLPPCDELRVRVVSSCLDSRNLLNNMSSNIHSPLFAATGQVQQQYHCNACHHMLKIVCDAVSGTQHHQQ